MRGRDEAEHRFGDRTGIIVVVGRRDRRAYSRVGEDAPRCGLDRAQPRQQRVRRVRMYHAEAEERQPPGVLKARPGQQQPARAPHQPPVGERHRQRAQLAKLARLRGGQRVVQPPPPGRVAAKRRERVGQVGQPEPPGAEYRVGAMPRRPSDQAGQHRSEAVGEAGKGCVQDDRLRRPDPRARPLGGGKERGLLQPRQDRGAQLGLQLAPRDPRRDQIEQGGSRGKDGQQASVDLGGLIEEEVGKRAGRDVTPVGAERKRGEQQRWEAQRFVCRRGCVHDTADPVRQAARRHIAVLAPRRDRHRPADRPGRARTLLGGTADEERRIGLPARGRRAPPADCAVAADRDAVAVVHRAERAGRAVSLDLDGGEGRERKHERGSCLGEQPLNEPTSGLVPQGQRDGGGEALGGRAVRGERQPQHGEVTRPPVELGGQRGNPPDEVAGGAARPGHRAGERGDARLVADRDGGGEAHTEPADRCRMGFGSSLAGGAQRGQRRDARRVQRRSCVRRHERSCAQRQPQPASHSRARRRVGRVLCQLHDDAVPVAAERVVLLGVGVLAEPRGRRRPGVEHPAAQLRGAERVGLAVLHGVDPPLLGDWDGAGPGD